MILYHGSSSIIRKPVFGFKSTNALDFGQGFYLSPDADTCRAWAVSADSSGYVMQYELDLSNLNILNLYIPPYTPLHWAALIVENRLTPTFRDYDPVTVDYIRKYLINMSDIDVIIGNRADDNYFDILNSFMTGTISLRAVCHSLYAGGLGAQVFIRSKQAFNQIEYLSHEIIDNNVWYSRKKENFRRASAAVHEYRQMYSNPRKYLRLNYIAADNLSIDDLVKRGDIVQENSPYIDAIIEAVEKEIRQGQFPKL